MTPEIRSADAAQTAIRIAVLFAVVWWCAVIVRPFLMPVTWGAVIAIGAYPGFRSLSLRLGNRPGLAAVLVTTLALALLIVPTLRIAVMAVANARDLTAALADGSLRVPPPPAEVAGWPVVGGTVARLWGLASTNLQAALSEVRPQVTAVATWLLGTVAGVGVSVLHLLAAIVIAGLLLPRAAAGHALATAVAAALAGDLGDRFVDIGERTIRSVARGVLGTAVIQAGLAAVGLLGAGIPWAALLSLLCLVLCIMQVGPALVLVPAIVWSFTTSSTLVASLFLVWSVLVMVSDNVLRPWLMRGSTEVPLLVVLAGVIGGLLAHGIVGLFVGPVVLGVAYELLRVWIGEGGRRSPLS